MLVDWSFWKKYLWKDSGTLSKAMTASQRQPVCCRNNNSKQPTLWIMLCYSDFLLVSCPVWNMCTISRSVPSVNGQCYFILLCYVRSQWPLTFEHWNLVGSFWGPNWSLYKIWRNSPKAFLRYQVHKTGTSWATWKSNAPGYTCSQRGAMKIIKGQKPKRILFVNLHSLQLNFKQKVFCINLTRNETGGCFLVRPSTSSNTRLKTDIIRRSYSLSVWTGPRVPYSWKLHDRVRDTMYHQEHHPGETSQTSKFQINSSLTVWRLSQRFGNDTWWSIVPSLCIHQLSPGCLWVEYQRLYHMRDKQTALLLTETDS